MEIDVRTPELMDPHGVEDIAANGLGDIDDLGDGSFRFTLYATDTVDGREVRVVVARVIVTAHDLPAILYCVASHIGLALVRAPKFIRWTVH